MKKLTAILLACVLIAGLFSGCSFNLFNREKGPQTGPVGEWSIPIPKINPLGSQSLYTDTVYDVEGHSITFVNNYQETSRSFQGEKWRLTVADSSSNPLKFLKAYAKKIGAALYPTPYADKVVFSLQNEKEKDVIWWGDAELNGEGYELSVMKEIYVIPGKPITIKPKELGEGVEKFSFATSGSGKKFQSMTVTLPGGVITLEGSSYMEKGVLSRKFDYMRELNSKKTSRFVLDDIPQGEGTMLWSISWEEAPEEFTVLLEDLYDIPEVRMGDELGTLKVTGVPFGDVSVEAPMGGDIVHADGYSLFGNMTPEGDTLFNLPAGYWTVVLQADGVNLTATKSRLVPVSAGEMTVLNLPNALKSTFSSLSTIYAENEDNSSGIELVETKDLTQTAALTFMVHDPKKRDIYPTSDNTKITEGGQEVKILDIKRQGIPPSVVLLLDSSGSMKKDMKGTIEAAKRFIQGLPDNSLIQVVDFDSEAKILKGTTKSEAIKSLSSVTASGSTVLYDSIMQGLELLEEKQRPALVVFSDGMDSSHDPKDVGSSATKEEVIETAKEALIPLYTIGFGASCDGSTLNEFAGVSGGVYYPAKDQKALENVFAAINSKFGNMFTLTYERPKEIAKNDTPVVSIVMDNSGSMDTDPEEEEGCGYRMDKVKGIFHDFVVKLPGECLTQVLKFHTGPLGGTIINIEQMTADRKPEMLQAIGEMEAGNGTPILESILAAYENIKPVPSSKKVIVYMTDAALEVPEEEQFRFEELLKAIKKDDIQVIWVGMGVQGKEDVFIRAAELSGGRYVVTEDVKQMEATLGEVLTLINQPKSSERIPLTLSIEDKTPSGEAMSYMASTMVAFSKPKVEGKAAAPDKVTTAAGTKIKRYDKDAASLIYGRDLPSRDTLIISRMAFNSSASNKAMEIKVKEAYTLGRFKGVDKPEGKQFLLLDMELKNTTVNKIPYLIPSFNSHFYVGINDKGMYPASEATWLAQMPAALPGEPEIRIAPGESVKGAMVFLIPDEPIEEEALYFYDISNGHVGVPLVGGLKQNLLSVAKLPAEQPVNITDAFSINIKGTSVEPKLDTVQAAENTSFRVIEAEFNTKVEALLDIEPAERLLLGFETAQGPLITRMNDVTAKVPFGMMRPVMLAPGSSNIARFAYQIPNVFSGVKTDIIGDLRDGSLQISVVKGKVYGTASSKPRIQGDGMEIRVNDLVSLNGIGEFGVDHIIADITIFDKKDGVGTTGLDGIFALIRDDYSEEAAAASAVNPQKGIGNFGDSSGESEYICEPYFTSSQLLFGIDDNFAVFDGASRRGLLVFTLPGENGHSWTLQSPFFKGLKEPVRGGSYGSPELMVYETSAEGEEDEFDRKLHEAISAAVAKYSTTKTAAGKEGYAKTVDLSANQSDKNNIPVPAIVFNGAGKLNSVNSLEDFYSTMERLNWLPAKSAAWNYRYSPEAVLTQGWGTEWDLVNLAEGLLSKLGYRPNKRMVKLTAEGKEKLLKLGGISESSITSLPALTFTDEKGRTSLFVIPFMKDITKLDNQVYMSAKQDKAELITEMATVKISIKVEPNAKDAASQFGDMANVLGGGEEGDGSSYAYVDVLTKELPLSALSIDAIDICYLSAGKGKGQIYTAGINTTGGIIVGEGYIDDGECKVLGVQISVAMQGQNGELIHETALNKDQKLTSLYHTLCINLPDLPKESVDKLEAAANKEYKAAKDPNDFSALRWYGRNVINRFITTQSEYDEKISKVLGIKLGRTSMARCILVTANSDEKSKKLTTSVDILQGINEVQSGSKEASGAYNIGAGLFVSQLEGRALPSGTSVELAEVWGNCPKDTTFAFIAGSQRAGAADKMKSLGYPEVLINHLEELERIFIVPSQPTMLDGEKRWAWLEIDPETLYTIAVLETGEHGAMAEFVMTNAPTARDFQNYVFGGLLGATTSIWAVSAFSLELDDYDEILANSMALVESIAGQMEFVLENAKEPEIPDATVMDLSAGPAKFELKVNKEFKLVGEVDHGMDIVSGFRDSAALYFKNAKKAK